MPYRLLPWILARYLRLGDSVSAPGGLAKDTVSAQAKGAMNGGLAAQLLEKQAESRH